MSERMLRWMCALLALATIAGMVALWPGERPQPDEEALGASTVGAEVTRVGTDDCGGPVAQDCVRVEVRVEGGATASLLPGPVGTFEAPSPGDQVRVQRAGEEWMYAGADRRGGLLVLVLAFAVLVVVIARWRGVLALLGLGLSLLLVVEFVIPALLAGEPGLLVALVGSFAVMFVTVVLTYGVSPPSLAACLGIAASLAFAAGAGALAVALASLDGHTGEISAYLASTGGGISLRGLVIAGMVIGALGVLADTGVTQASTVMALRKANPRLSARGLFRGAFGVGRDHLVATTHTLVLVYLGASLPLLLWLGSGGVAAADALNSQEVAEPVAAMLVGAIALLVSVPLTTALCAVVAHRMPPEALHGAHVHAH